MRRLAVAAFVGCVLVAPSLAAAVAVVAAIGTVAALGVGVMTAGWA